MILRDLLEISAGNLRRMKLRAFLTVSGVVIAIAAFVSMVSFGAGNQRYVAQQYRELGLFTTMQVYPPKSDPSERSDAPRFLDQSAVETLSAIPGVRLAYPYDAFPVVVVALDTQAVTKAQALPSAAARTRLFSQITSGRAFANDSANEALVTEELLKLLGIDEPDSILGEEIVISVSLASMDSGLVYVFSDETGILTERLEQVRFDSLLDVGYSRDVVRREINAALQRFLHGFVNARRVASDTLSVCGVLKGTGRERVRVQPVIIPVATARRLTSGGFSGDHTDLFAALSSGALFATESDDGGGNYPQVTLDLDPDAAPREIRDTVEALGFRVFSFAEAFEEMSRFFFYFDLALGVVGLIALLTASLGIANTMVMSIVERTREIGVLKSLGADERDIKLLFLVESGVIGSIGAILGILLGFLISRVASAVAQALMAREGIEGVDLFAMPAWLVLIAFCFGLLVSLVAGSYPASRAARVDPVEALRNE
jgi:putative ABC transport system permease protein